MHPHVPRRKATVTGAPRRIRLSSQSSRLSACPVSNSARQGTTVAQPQLRCGSKRLRTLDGQIQPTSHRELPGILARTPSARELPGGGGGGDIDGLVLVLSGRAWGRFLLIRAIERCGLFP